MGVFILAIWLIFFGWAGITFPFVGHETTGQNIAYGAIVGLPFLILMGIYMVLAVKDLREAAARKEKAASKRNA